MHTACLLMPYQVWGVLEESSRPPSYCICLPLLTSLVGQPYSLPAGFLLPSFSVTLVCCA